MRIGRDAWLEPKGRERRGRKESGKMDERTPIEVPIRLEEWDRHDCINEVDTIVVDIRPILDAT